MALTASTLALSAIVGGAGLSAGGALAAGRQQQKNLEFNAAVQRNQAIREEQAAEIEAGRIRERGAALRAAQRAGFAKAGVGIEGTPIDVLGATADQIQRDIELTFFGGAQRARAFRTQAGLSIAQGRAARGASFVQAGTSLLGGVFRGISAFKQLEE